MTEISIREEEKWINKGTDKQEMADSFLHNTTYHTQCLYKISSSYVKQFLRNFHIHYTGVTDGKTKKWKKNGKTNTGHLIFSYTMHFDTV